MLVPSVLICKLYSDEKRTHSYAVTVVIHLVMVSCPCTRLTHFCPGPGTQWFVILYSRFDEAL